jgi:hypothetical protein
MNHVQQKTYFNELSFTEQNIVINKHFFYSTQQNDLQWLKQICHKH